MLMERKWSSLHLPLTLLIGVVYVTSPNVLVTTAQSINFGRPHGFTRSRGHSVTNTTDTSYEAPSNSLPKVIKESGRSISNNAHITTFISKLEITTQFAHIYAFLRDVLISLKETHTLVIITTSDAARNQLSLMSATLAIPIIIYDSAESDIEQLKIKGNTNRNPFYAVVLDNVDLEIYMKVLKNIKEKDYTGKVLIMLDKAENNNNIMEHLATSGYYELYFAVRSGRSNINYDLEIKEICAYCYNGKNSLHVLNYWKLMTGFKFEAAFPPCFKGSFHSAKIKVATNRFMIYAGIEYHLLRIAMERLNFTLKFVYPKKISWGSLLDGKWTGIIGMVYYNQAEIAVGKVSITSERFSAVNPTSLIDTSKFVMISRKPSKSPRWDAILEALTYKVWALLIITTVLVGLVQYLICRLLPNGTPMIFFSAIFIPFQILFIEPVRFMKPGVPTIVLFTAWMLPTILIQSFYTGSMQSILIKPKPSEKPVDTIERLIESEKKLLLYKHMSAATFLLSAYNLSGHFQLYTPTLSGAKLSDLLLNDTKYVGIADVNNIYERAIITLKENNPYHYGTEGLSLEFNSWMVSKTCPYKDHITKALMDAHRFGLVQHYSDKMAFKRKQGYVQENNIFNKPDTADNVLTVRYAWEIIKVYLMMNMSCIIIFFLEKCYNAIYIYLKGNNVLQSSNEGRGLKEEVGQKKKLRELTGTL